MCSSDLLTALTSLARLESSLGNAEKANRLIDQVFPEAEKFRADFPNATQWALVLGLAQAKRNRAAEAVAAVDGVLERTLRSRNIPVERVARRNRAAVLAAVGRAEEAVTELERLRDTGQALGYTLRTNEDFDPLRNHPRFQKLMAQAEAEAAAQKRTKR